MLKLIIHALKKVRNLYLKKITYHRYDIGKNFHCGRGVILWAKNKLVIGDDFYIGRYSQIECDAIIGDNVIFANHVALVGKYDHKYDEVGVPIRQASQIRDANYNWKGLTSQVVIGDDVWVGYGATILSGVQIGKGAIIAANSLVIKDVAEYAIVAGNPARFLKYRFNAEEIKKHERKLYGISRN